MSGSQYGSESVESHTPSTAYGARGCVRGCRDGDERLDALYGRDGVNALTSSSRNPDPERDPLDVRDESSAQNETGQHLRDFKNHPYPQFWHLWLTSGLKWPDDVAWRWAENQYLTNTTEDSEGLLMHESPVWYLAPLFVDKAILKECPSYFLAKFCGEVENAIHEVRRDRRGDLNEEFWVEIRSSIQKVTQRWRDANWDGEALTRDMLSKRGHQGDL